MTRALYIGCTGMINEQKRLDLVSNNIANSATTGYKAENVTSQSFEDVLALKIRDNSEYYVDNPIGNMNFGVKLGEVYTNFGQGPLHETGNDFDLAIEGNGFFEIREGENIRYTRDGNFKLTKDGYIVDSDGNHLQGQSGDIQIPVDSSSVSIDVTGRISVDMVPVDTVKLVDFEDYDYLKKIGDTSYKPVDGAVTLEGNGLIRQGFTEQSNVNAVSEMVDLIAITRAYEANQKVIHTEDSLLEKAVNQVGKL